MRHLIIGAAVALLCPLLHAASLCHPGEVDYFSCKTTLHGKVASVCGNITNREIDEHSWVQYRFGKAGAVEFTYPSEKSGSINKFEGNHFNKYGVIDLRFMNKDVLYSVALYSAYSGEDALERPHPSAQIHVQEGLKRARTIKCARIDQARYYPAFSALNEELEFRNGPMK